MRDSWRPVLRIIGAELSCGDENETAVARRSDRRLILDVASELSAHLGSAGKRPGACWVRRVQNRAGVGVQITKCSQ